jgi:cardiolipin synthase
MEEKVWRDTGVRVQGDEVKKILQAFFGAWKKSRFQSVPPPPANFESKRSRQRVAHSLLRLNTSAQWRFLLLQDLKRRLRSTKSRILITNAYFLPRQAVLRHLRKASRRGTYVALCLPGKSDVPPVQWASRSLFYRLMKDGVQIFEYQPSILHAKTMVIDDWATVGSNNLNHRSLHHDLEIEAVIEDSLCVQKLVAQFDDDVRHSRKLTFEDLGKMGLMEKILARLTYWFRYWL